MNDAVIVDAVRTASGRGKPGGALSAVHPADLLAAPLKELLRRTGVDPGMVDDVIAGCVGQVGRADGEHRSQRRAGWRVPGLGARRRPLTDNAGRASRQPISRRRG